MKMVEYSGKKGKGKFFKVSDESFEKVRKYKWCLHHTGYAVTNIKQSNGKYKSVRLNRFLMDCPQGMEVDHKDCDIENYQLENLRIATQSQNNSNRRKRLNCLSKFKGLHWNRKFEKWYVRIFINKKKICLGGFKKEIDAARAYNEAVKKYFGEFARLNQI